MRLLAIETATEACSAALYVNGDIRVRHRVEPRRHGELILGMIADVLKEAGIALRQLDALAFGRGPGSFTGVRIASGVIQGIAFAADLPVVPVSTLAALAQHQYRRRGSPRILAGFDARMKEVYWGAYEAHAETGLVSLAGVERVCRPTAVPLPSGSGWCGVGTAWASYRDQLAERLGERVEAVDDRLLCSAHDIAQLGVAGFAEGRAVPAERALPVYLRDQVVQR